MARSRRIFGKILEDHGKILLDFGKLDLGGSRQDLAGFLARSWQDLARFL